MKVLVVFALAVVAVQANKTLWDQFKFQHEKFYNSIDQEVYRYRVFESNLKIIKDHNERYNQGLETFTMAVNQFADMTAEERLSMLKLQADNKPSIFNMGVFNKPQNGELPEEVDWRSKGAVTDVKNQRTCGSCWAFSATGSLEGQIQIQTGKLVSLSEQNLLDCSKSYGNRGCDGGYMTNAFTYIKENGIETEESYPYENKVNKTCRYNSTKSVVSIKGYKEVTAYSEEDLQSAVATVGPISLGICATDKLFFYSTGIFSDFFCNPKALNHGVLGVGYGSEAKGDFWTIKNSWGSTWGDKGYFKMARNMNNQCGVASMACYPVL